MFFGATRVAIATQRYQPNKKLSVDLLLTSEEVPGGGWTTSIQQEMPANSFSKGAPEMIRAKEMKSTTSKSLFKDSSELRTVLIEVTPLATISDAESWVSSAEERVKRKMLKYVALDRFEDLGDFTLANVGLSVAFNYTMAVPKGVRTSVVVATNVGDVYTIVTCSDVGRNWTVEDVQDVVQAQIEKIRIAKFPPNE